jgi:inhibitor of the pro-sigma K processing machinery
MAEMMILGPFLTFLFLALLVIVAWKVGKGIVWLAINSMVGVVALFLLNFLPSINIVINIWSVLIVVLGGVPGIILVILLSHLEIVF